MSTVSFFDAKTHLSRIVEDLVSGRHDQVIISRHGKPMVCVLPIKTIDASKRIGIAKGHFDIPVDIDAINDQIVQLFGAEPPVS